jgi:hypothetical protein
MKQTKTRKSQLDDLARKLRAALGRETTNIVEIGELLLQARKLFAAHHGEWKPWLAENFDLSYRTAVNYCAAAEYAAGRGKVQRLHICHGPCSTRWQRGSTPRSRRRQSWPQPGRGASILSAP